MENYLDRMRALTQNSMHAMFAAEKNGDNEAMEAAVTNYSTMLAATDALSKMTPKPPKMLSKLRCCRCPSCNRILGGEMRHCDNCGQRLDWGRPS